MDKVRKPDSLVSKASCCEETTHELGAEALEAKADIGGFCKTYSLSCPGALHGDFHAMQYDAGSRSFAAGFRSSSAVHELCHEKLAASMVCYALPT